MTRAASGRAAQDARRAVEVRNDAAYAGYGAAPTDPNGQARHDIAGIVIGVVGVALLIAVLTPTTGVLTKAVSDALHALLGLGAFIVPLAMIVWSVMFFIPTSRIMPGRIAAGLGLIALAVISLLGITTPGATTDASILFNSYVLADRGGYLGNGFAWLLLQLTGKIVGIVILVGIAIAGLVVIGFSFSDALLSLRLRIRERRELSRREAQERAAQHARDLQQAWLDEQYDEDEDLKDSGYTPTSLFNPDRPLSSSQLSRDAVPTDMLDANIPTSVLDRAASRSKSGRRASSQRIRTFGCGTRPLEESPEYEEYSRYGQQTPETAETNPTVSRMSPLDTHGYEGVDYLPVEYQDGHEAVQDGGGAGNSPNPYPYIDADQTTIVPPISPDMVAYDSDGYERYDGPVDESLLGNSAAGVRHHGIDSPFDMRMPYAAEPVNEERERPSRHDSSSRNWWEDARGDADESGYEDEADLTIAEVPGLAVPGVIPGMPTLKPMPGVSDSQPSKEEANEENEENPDATVQDSAQPVAAYDAEAVDQAFQKAVARDDRAHAASLPLTSQQEKRTAKAETPLATLADAPSRVPSGAAGSEPLPWEDAPDAGKESAPAQSQASEQPQGSPEQPKASASEYRRPSAKNLHHNPGGLKKSAEEEAEIRQMADKLAQTLAEFKVAAKVVGWVEGPTCTTYEVQPGEGVRVSKFTSLEEDISRSLARESVRIYSPVHGTPYIGIEVPNTTRQAVFFGDVLPGVKGGPLDVAVGLDAEGKPINVDLATLPHLLIAGTTGSGKSVMVNSIICSMLMRDTPDDVRLIMVDPKQVELTGYNGIPHLIMPVVSDPRQAASALQWGVTEMDRRYRVFSTLGVRNIAAYNEMVDSTASQNREFPLKHLPYVVIIIDELTDLMMVAKKDVEASIVRIAQLGRAAGIHLVLATQRPSADVVTGLIKANVGNRMGLKVATGIDSKVVLDQTGAEKLLGRGDMLFLQTKWGDKPRRIQGCFLSDPEIADIVDQLRAQNVETTDCGMAPIGSSSQLTLDGALDTNGGSSSRSSSGSSNANDDDPLAYKAARLVVENQLGSTSMIQRRLKLGYARAGRVMDMLEEMGIVGPARGGKTREVLVHDMDELATIFGSEYPEEDG